MACAAVRGLQAPYIPDRQNSSARIDTTILSCYGDYSFYVNTTNDDDDDDDEDDDDDLHARPVKAANAGRVSKL